MTYMTEKSKALREERDKLQPQIDELQARKRELTVAIWAEEAAEKERVGSPKKAGGKGLSFGVRPAE